MLRKNKTTGVFLILNTGDEDYPKKGEEIYKNGIYLRDYNPGDNPGDNGDLIMEKGPSSIAKGLGIALGTTWDPKFIFSGDQEEGYNYFFKPYIAGEQYKKSHLKDLGYWSPKFKMKDDSVDIITYSVPIVDDKGEAYGVLGIDLTTEYVASYFPDEEISENMGSYVLGVKKGDELKFKGNISTGAWYNKEFENYNELLFSDEDIYHKDYLLKEDGLKDKVYGSIRYLNLYNSNTPFESEKWAVIGLTQGSEVFGVLQSLIRSLVVLFVLSTTIGVISVFILSKKIVNPITELAKKVRTSSVNKPIKFDSVGILEVDELSASIENLRESVADYSSKLSKITRMTDFYISAFEYKYDSNDVYVPANSKCY